MDLFAKALAGANLSPAQRAILRAVEGILASALVAFAVALPGLTHGFDFSQTNWGAVAGGLAVAIILAFAKYERAHGDAPLANVAENAAGSVRAWADVPNDVVIEPELPQVPDDATPPAA